MFKDISEIGPHSSLIVFYQ